MSNKQSNLGAFGTGTGYRYSDLTDAEQAAYVACRINGVGVREFTRRTDRRPGTIGNLLARAEGKLEEGST